MTFKFQKIVHKFPTGWMKVIESAFIKKGAQGAKCKMLLKFQVKALLLNITLEDL